MAFGKLHPIYTLNFMNIKHLLTSIVFAFFSVAAFSQDFLHVDGKNIVNGNGENVILRGIGTGNWMLQEGYMMQSSDVAGTQHEFRNKLINNIGLTKTDEFYDAWLSGHFTKADVDSMKKWGFNSVRVALHYKWFTPPIENEPVAGQITWYSKGFEMIDELLYWCQSNKMYLILDLHGAPGGQGKDAAISDYDSSKPSLWESELNKAKTVALWRKFAERYNTEPWIGGYDLLNETNWTFTEANNAPLRDLYGRITNAIREVDNNHILFIEGNWFANDFTGLTPAWDANMVYSFHKYWTYNTESSIKWMLDLRNSTNRPIWLGETGENSNTWFTSLVTLVENNNIGWSWWPVKKSGINNVLFVETNEDYKGMISAWKSNTNISAEAAFNAVMTFANNHKVQNCKVQYDVIDALIRQPFTVETKPFKKHTIDNKIFFADYDFGRNGYAYWDTDTANYRLDTQTFVAWNQGWTYRNDGVDIEKCSDTETNGYNVGWTNKGEWLQYTIAQSVAGAYKFEIRAASQTAFDFHIEANGKVVSEIIHSEGSGSWTTWQTTTVNDIILPDGEVKIRFVLDNGTANLNYFIFSEPKNVSEVAFKCVSAFTHTTENQIFINFNKAISSTLSEIVASNFQLKVNNAEVTISEIILPTNNPQQLILVAGSNLLSSDAITVSYNGSTVLSQTQPLTAFSGLTVQNRFFANFSVPGKLEVENFLVNNGFALENCTDAGGGKNTGYANNGDYLDFFVNVAQAGNYNVEFRVATIKSDASVSILISEGDEMVEKKVMNFTNTGGWQTWQTQSTIIALPAGKIIFRIYSRSSEYNLNWLNFTSATAIETHEQKTSFELFPNPTSDMIFVKIPNNTGKQIQIFDMCGKQIISLQTSEEEISVDVKSYPVGTYIMRMIGKENVDSLKFQIVR